MAIRPAPLLCALVLLSPAARGQGIVQQPVVQQFSVDTVVSVPDRGSAFLGGVATGRSGRSVYGPLPLSRSLGFEYGYSRVEVGVFIHDFEAMDAALLSAAPAGNPSAVTPVPAAVPSAAVPPPRARKAWESLHRR